MKIASKYLGAILVGTALALTAGFAAAQAYPSKPIKMIVPYPPGGPTDVQARVVAARLGESLGQTVVVENRGGVGGMLGSSVVAKSAPDGYTLLMGASGPHAIGPLMSKEPLYGPIKDFTPISLVSYSPLMLVVHPSVKAKSVSEIIALAKSTSGGMSYGSFGNGTMAHLAGELFRTMAGVDLVHVPYKGSAPAMADLLGGQIPMMFDTIITALPHVKAGKLRGIAVTKSTRSEAVPDMPTVAESGLPEFAAVSWIGLMGPADMPADVVKRLSDAMVDLLRDPSVRQRLADAGAEPVGSDSTSFAAHMKQENGRWEPVVRAAGLYRKN